MSNYKIVEDPTVVPEGVSVSETSKKWGLHYRYNRRINSRDDTIMV